MICEIDGWVLAACIWGAGAGAVLGRRVPGGAGAGAVLGRRGMFARWP